MTMSECLAEKRFQNCERGKDMPMEPVMTWIGIGAKVSGMGLIYKREFTYGKFFNLAMPHETVTFQIKNSGWGLGLGGGTGLIVACYFNVYSPPQYTSISDWSIDLSLGGKWDEAVKALNKYKFFARIAKIGTKLKNLVENIQEIQESVNELYDIYDVVDGKKTLITMETPVGWGVEVSAAKMSGTLEITDYAS